MHANDSGKRHTDLFLQRYLIQVNVVNTLHEKENFKIPFLASYILWPDKG